MPFNRAEPAFETVHQVDEHLYTYLTPFLFNGTQPIHNRGVVVHLAAAKELAVINPAELTPKVLSDLKALEQTTGAKVRYLLSPGDWHYLFIGAYLGAFPGSTAYVPPGRIPSKQPDYPYTVLDLTKDQPLPQLSPHLEVLTMRGMLDFEDPAKLRPRYELAFYHRASETFTAADFFMYYGVGEMNPVVAAAGLRPGHLEFHFFKNKVIRDSAAVAASIDRLLQFKPKNYICQHGGLGNMLVGSASAGLEELRTWAGTLGIVPS